MELKFKTDEKEMFKAKFTTIEAKSLRGAYRERLYMKASQEPPLVPTESEVVISNLTVSEKDGSEMSFPFSMTRAMAGVLRDFHADTDRQVVEISRRTSTPNYANDHIAERIRLGHAAARLADEVSIDSENMLVHNLLINLDNGSMMREFVSVDGNE